MTTVHHARRLGPAPAPAGLPADERLSRDELQARQLPDGETGDTEGLAPHFQLKLTRNDRMDHRTVLVEARLGTAAGRRPTAAAEIASRVRDGVGISVAVEVCDPGTLERSAGKIRRVIDQRAQ